MYNKSQPPIGRLRLLYEPLAVIKTQSKDLEIKHLT